MPSGFPSTSLLSFSVFGCGCFCVKSFPFPWFLHDKFPQESILSAILLSYTAFSLIHIFNYHLPSKFSLFSHKYQPLLWVPDLEPCLKITSYLTWAKIKSWLFHSPNLATIPLCLRECYCLPLISRPNILASSLTFLPFITSIYFLKETYWLCHLTSSQMLFSTHTALVLVLCLPSAFTRKIFWLFSLLSLFHSSNQRKECLIINQLISFASLQAWSAFFKSLTSDLHLVYSKSQPYWYLGSLNM